MENVFLTHTARGLRIDHVTKRQAVAFVAAVRLAWLLVVCEK